MFSLGIPLLRDGVGFFIFHKVSFEKHSNLHTLLIAGFLFNAWLVMTLFFSIHYGLADLITEQEVLQFPFDSFNSEWVWKGSWALPWLFILGSIVIDADMGQDHSLNGQNQQTGNWTSAKLRMARTMIKSQIFYPSRSTQTKRRMKCNDNWHCSGGQRISLAT